MPDPQPPPSALFGIYNATGTPWVLLQSVVSQGECKVFDVFSTDGEVRQRAAVSKEVRRTNTAILMEDETDPLGLLGTTFGSGGTYFLIDKVERKESNTDYVVGTFSGSYVDDAGIVAYHEGVTI